MIYIPVLSVLATWQLTPVLDMSMSYYRTSMFLRRHQEKVSPGYVTLLCSRPVSHLSCIHNTAARSQCMHPDVPCRTSIIDPGHACALQNAKPGHAHDNANHTHDYSHGHEHIEHCHCPWQAQGVRQGLCTHRRLQTLGSQAR